MIVHDPAALDRAVLTVFLGMALLLLVLTWGMAND